MRRVLIVVAMLILVILPVHTQDSTRTKPMYLHAGKIGLGLDGITGSPNLLLKYFFNNQLALEAIVGLDLDVPGGSTPAGSTRVTGITLRGGLAMLFHITQDQVSPYVGVEGVFQYTKSGGFYAVIPDPKHSVFASGVLGAEFFLHERFTVGIKQNLGLSIYLKRDRPSENTDIKFNTSTLVTGRVYFN